MPAPTTGPGGPGPARNGERGRPGEQRQAARTGARGEEGKGGRGGCPGHPLLGAAAPSLAAHPTCHSPPSPEPPHQCVASGSPPRKVRFLGARSSACAGPLVIHTEGQRGSTEAASAHTRAACAILCFCGDVLVSVVAAGMLSAVGRGVSSCRSACLISHGFTAERQRGGCDRGRAGSAYEQAAPAAHTAHAHSPVTAYAHV